jgi:transcriptional regulator with XRE-family HTH domain
MPTPEQLRAALIAERHRLGLTQRQVGEILGRHSYNTVHQWERGVNEPKLSNLLAWVAALGLTLTLAPQGADTKGRQPMRHELKCWPDYYVRLADGSKTFEVRRNDRFQLGDELVLYLFDPKGRTHECSDPDCSQNWRGDRVPRLTFRVGFVASGAISSG